VELLRLPATATAINVQDELNRLRSLNQIGSQLAQICAPKQNVVSASSLGSSLETLQATKTVSQARIPRRRVDRRVRTSKPAGRFRNSLLEFLQAGPAGPAGPAGQAGVPLPEPRLDSSRLGLFGEFNREWRKRDNSTYELGYDGHLNNGLIGVDYGWNRNVVGLWFGFSEIGTDYNVQLSSLNRNYIPGQPGPVQPRDLEEVIALCEGRRGSGSFEDHSKGFGGFAGFALGSGGLLDIGVSRYTTDHAYTRKVCTFEEGPNSNPNLDEFFAGWASGTTDVTDLGFSVRSGYDIEKDRWIISPRGVFQFMRTSVDSYVETGNGTTKGDSQPIVTGGPIGSELAYEAQKRNSTWVDLGGEIAHRFDVGGTILIPEVSGYWRHQFDDDFVFSTVNFAQDRRADPLKFMLATEGADPNSAIFSVGLNSLIRERVGAQVELSQLFLNDRVRTTLLSVRVRVRI
jgi:uncharacterized protein YhjY with autotransporter beta-barrel domain